MSARPRGRGYRPPAAAPPYEAHRDAALRVGEKTIPPRASNRDLVLSVLDQGGMNSCVAHAGFQAIRASHVLQGVANPPLGSRLWGYLWARALNHETEMDNGTYLSSFFDAMDRLGYPPESSWPYIDDGVRFRAHPPLDTYRQAISQRAPTTYLRIFQTGAARLTVVRQALADEFLVAIGLQIGPAFEAWAPGAAPIDPPAAGTAIGGHAVCLTGFDTDAGTFEYVNSWGASYGDAGYGQFSDAAIVAAEELVIVEAAPPFAPVPQ